MLISGDKAERVYRKIAAIQQHMNRYCLSSGSLKLSVEDLQWAITDMYGLHIDKFEVSFDADFVRGLVERYSDGRVEIYIRGDQPEDMKRFVATKELCHVFIDEEDDWSANGTKTIEDLVYESSIQSNQLATPQAQSEQLALLAALELVYPFEFRKNDMSSLKSRKTSQKKIALEHGIPQYVVGLSLHENTMSVASQCWLAINAANSPSTSG